MCVFCKIINKEIPSYQIYEDDACIAFLDISQASRGHVLVVPKKHSDNILSLDEEEASHLFQVATKLTKHISKQMNILNFNIINNCGTIAGQTVPHFHIHIIPRCIGDNNKFVFDHNVLTKNEFDNLVTLLKYN